MTHETPQATTQSPNTALYLVLPIPTSHVKRAPSYDARKLTLVTLRCTHLIQERSQSGNLRTRYHSYLPLYNNSAPRPLPTALYTLPLGRLGSLHKKELQPDLLPLLIQHVHNVLLNEW